MEINTGDKVPEDTDVTIPAAEETELSPSNTETDVPPPTLSKNQLKKIQKREKWLQHKQERRKQKKEKTKQNRKKLRELGEDLGPSRKQLKRNRMKDSACQIQVVVDCSFDDLMSDKDVQQLVQQLGHAYSVNRRAPEPLQFHVTGVNSKTKARLDDVGDYVNWDVNFHADDYTEVFSKQQIVYLSSESPHILETLTDDKVYVIGGLVDHNHQKGLCHRLAEEKGLRHAQLPIGDYLELKSRKVLTINHVFEILLRYTEQKSWEEAFFSVIPKRKGAKVKKKKVPTESAAAVDTKATETLEKEEVVATKAAAAAFAKDSATTEAEDLAAANTLKATEAVENEEVVAMKVACNEHSTSMTSGDVVSPGDANT